MHPILFRIPLPDKPLKIWWFLVIAMIVAAAYAAFALRSKERGTAVVAGALGLGALVAAYVYRASVFQAPYVPIYSYGVMLGLSLVVGWYLTLTLAERDGLPKETMANCYVFTAIAAIAGSRVLYVLTNLDEFHAFSDIFAFRRGGLVAYGGFIGGYLGSWAYLSMNKVRLMPWADVAVPSLASGLLITRIGCYLFGCDFGKRLPDDAPAFLKKLGTFPHWAAGTLDSGDGAPAYVRHLDLYRGTPLGAELARTNASLPVHPTQIYESLCGLLLLGVLLWQRKNQKFRGQIFFTFAFGYGFLRFLLEIIRDDVERGEYGPMMAEHVLVPGALLLFSLGFSFGLALGIKNPTMRTMARVLSFVPPLVAYLVLRPPSFGSSVVVMLSTSQWIALSSALLVSYFYAQYWAMARRSPALAMGLGSLGDFATDDEAAKEAPDDAEDEGDEDNEEETRAEAPIPKSQRKKGLVAKGKTKAEDLGETGQSDKAKTSAPDGAAAPRGAKGAIAKAGEKRDTPDDEPAPPKKETVKTERAIEEKS
jgi:phosphatidylglycerol:prolipoprotein diacylglycerol transferase